MRILKKKILLALSLPVDFFKGKESFSYYPYSFLYFLIKFKKGSVRDAIGQLVKSGEVDKIIRNNMSYFRLTGVGRERLLSLFPISVGQGQVWDQRWRIIIKNVKCQMSNVKLKEFGFKKLARGVYITPMPISEELKSYLLEENLLGGVVIVESRGLLTIDNKDLAKKIWNLEELAKRYNDFIKQCKRLLKRVVTKKRLKDREENEVVKLFDSYFFLLFGDPGLPKKVLLDDWPADFAREIFLDFFEQLRGGKLLDIF